MTHYKKRLNNKKTLSVLILFLITVSLVGIDLSLPSIPAIKTSFNISVNETQFTITIFLLGFGVAQAFYGPLSDWFGRRKIMLFGITMGVFGSLLSTLAQGIVMLDVSRFIWGSGVSVIWVLVRAIMRDVFEGYELARLASYVAITWSATLAIAPTMGGYMQYYLGWRFCFLFLTFYNLLALILVKYFLFETVEKSPGRFYLKDIVAGYKSLLFQRSFVQFVLICTLAFGGLTVYYAMGPFIFMDEFKLNSISYGWLGVYFSLTYMVCAGINSRIVPVLGIYKVLSVGATLMFFGSLGILFSSAFHVITLTTLLIFLILFIAGVAFSCPTATVGALTAVTSAYGLASALYGTMQMLGASLCTGLASMLFPPRSNSLGVILTILTIGCLALLCSSKVKSNFINKNRYSLKNT